MWFFIVHVVVYIFLCPSSLSTNEIKYNGQKFRVFDLLYYFGQLFMLPIILSNS